ncbi:MAG TPA: hypothetical protein VGP24_10610 [Glaciihabitans sp.]|nr:hypothetical protein [Glaciihabitans sp.]
MKTNGDRVTVIVLEALGDVVVSVDDESNRVEAAGVIERVVELAIPVQLGGAAWCAFVATVCANLLAIDKSFSVEHSCALLSGVCNARVEVISLAGHYDSTDLDARR